MMAWQTVDDGMRWHPPFSVHIDVVVPSMTLVRPDEPFHLIHHGVERVARVECFTPVSSTIGAQQGINVIAAVDSEANIDSLITRELVDNTMHVKQEVSTEVSYA